MKRNVNCLFCCLLLWGCSRGAIHEGLPVLRPCSVTVLQETKPLAGAAVSLQLVDGVNNWIVSGETDLQGVAKLQTQMRYPGAPQGHYKVMISKVISDPPIELKPATEDSVAVLEFVTFRYSDAKYENSKTTPLEMTISAEGPNTATFDIGKPVQTRIN